MSAAGRKRLIAALRAEHVDDCRDERCDITAAVEAGYPLWAAHVLTGATEAYETQAALDALRPTRAEIEREREEFVESVPHATCRKCGSTSWNAPPAETCADCLAPLKGRWGRAFAKRRR